MVRVEREATDENMCNSCLDREAPTYRMQVGTKVYSTNLYFCDSCLQSLNDESAEALNL